MSQTESGAEKKPVSPVMAGLRCRCPACGEGRVFTSYLKLAAQCPVCGEDFTKADTGDGPAFFVSFAALILFAPAFFIVPLIHMPIWAKVAGILLIIAAMTAFCIALLPPGKSLMMALQWRHKAGEGRLQR